MSAASAAKISNLEKAREALKLARANVTIKKHRKERKPRAELRTTFSMSDAGALTISDGRHGWPLSIEETRRLTVFLGRFGEVSTQDDVSA
jgi:hypothetical protein